jgi:hypothetical protein
MCSFQKYQHAHTKDKTSNHYACPTMVGVVGGVHPGHDECSERLSAANIVAPAHPMEEACDDRLLLQWMCDSSCDIDH